MPQKIARLFRPLPRVARQTPVSAVADSAYERGYAEGWSAAAELFGVQPAIAPGKAAVA